MKKNSITARMIKPRIKVTFTSLLSAFCISTLLISCNNNSGGNAEEVAIPVSVQSIELGSIEQFIETSGTVNPTHEVTLRSEVTGKYHLETNPRTKKPFKLGDNIKEGEVLISLKDEEYENTNAIESKQLNLEIAKRLYDQQKSLYEKGGVTLKDLTDAESSYINAKYTYENAKLTMAKLKIVAPFDGTIVEQPYYTPNVKLNSGSTIAKIMAYKNLYLEIDLPEKEMGNILVGQKARVFNYSYPTDTFIANVTQLSPVINTSSRSFKGFISVHNPNLKLRPGMFVKAEILTASRDSAIVIPRELILSSRRGPSVFIVEQSTARDRDLVLGLENPTEVEVLEGLSPEDRLVVKGYETLRNRSKVKVVN